MDQKKINSIVADLLGEHYEYGYSNTFADLHAISFEIRGLQQNISAFSALPNKELDIKAAKAGIESRLRKLKEQFNIDGLDELNAVISKYYDVRAREVIYGS